MSHKAYGLHVTAVQPGQEDIVELFGMDKKLADSLLMAMSKFFAAKIGEGLFGKHDHDKDGNCLNKSHIQPDGAVDGLNKAEILIEFLNSKEFKKLNWNPSKPNDYWILGFTFVPATELAQILIKNFILEEKTTEDHSNGASSLFEKIFGRKSETGHDHKIEIHVHKK